MKNSIYQSAKANLKHAADRVKLSNPTDLPYCRQAINDEADNQSRIIDHYAMKGHYSNAKAEQCKEWLHSYAGQLHPKK